jgi:hypothetical protein
VFAKGVMGDCQGGIRDLLTSPIYGIRRGRERLIGMPEETCYVCRIGCFINTMLSGQHRTEKLPHTKALESREDSSPTLIRRGRRKDLVSSCPLPVSYRAENQGRWNLPSFSDPRTAPWLPRGPVHTHRLLISRRRNWKSLRGALRRFKIQCVDFVWI